MKKTIEIFEPKRDNIPGHEVLAFNAFTGYYLIGYLSHRGLGEWQCENEHEVLFRVTHYMEIPEIEVKKVKL